MRLILLSGAMVLALISAATATSNDYLISVHVSGSSWLLEPAASGPDLVQKLDVTIGGKHYQLEANFFGGDPRREPLLALGDYKARLVRDSHRSPYESAQVYELLFPDNKTKEYVVVGQFES